MYQSCNFFWYKKGLITLLSYQPSGHFQNGLTQHLLDFLCAQSPFVDADVIDQMAQRHAYLICPFMDFRGRACPIGIVSAALQNQRLFQITQHF